MEPYYQVIADLEKELAKKDNVSKNVLEQIQFAIGHCRIALRYLKDAVISEGFLDKESEILFFKELKPKVYSKLLYYQALFEIESTRQNTDKGRVKKYLDKKLSEVLKFMDRNKQKVQYYRCNFEHFDEKYFTRGNEEIPIPIRDHHSPMDEEFFTWNRNNFKVYINPIE